MFIWMVWLFWMVWMVWLLYCFTVHMRCVLPCICDHISLCLLCISISDLFADYFKKDQPNSRDKPAMDFLIRSVSAKQHGTIGNMGTIPCKFFKPSHPFFPFPSFQADGSTSMCFWSSWLLKWRAIYFHYGVVLKKIAVLTGQGWWSVTPDFVKDSQGPWGELIQQRTSERICEVFFGGGKLWWLICEMLDSVDEYKNDMLIVCIHVSNCKFIFGMIWEVSITSLGSEMKNHDKVTPPQPTGAAGTSILRDVLKDC